MCQVNVDFCECLRVLSIFHTCYRLVTQHQGRDDKFPQSWPASCPPSNGLTSRGKWVFPGTASSSFTKGQCLGTHHHCQRAEELSRQELTASDAFLTTLSAGAPREQWSHTNYPKTITSLRMSLAVLGNRSPRSVKGWATNRVLILMRKGGQCQSSGNICVQTGRELIHIKHMSILTHTRSTCTHWLKHTHIKHMCILTHTQSTYMLTHTKTQKAQVYIDTYTQITWTY